MDSPDALALLRSIDASLKALVARQAPATAAPSTGAKVASDADLDGTWGDPEVKAKDPRDWTGEPMKGRKFSECPAEYLDLLAERLDYFAEKNAAGTEDEQKKARYQRLDASRARGWAARIRAGKVKAPPATPGWSDPDAGSDSEDSVTF